MTDNILVLYGSYRSDRLGIRLANYIVTSLRQRGNNAELIDAKDVGLPMLDRMYKEYPKGSAPPEMERLAAKIRGADAFVFVTGEYNWGMQPGLKNLTDHYLEEWFWRPAAIVSYSGGRLSGAHAAVPGMALFPRWEWSSSQAPLPSPVSRQHWTLTINLSGAEAMPLRELFPVLPTTSPGGPRQ